MSGELYPSEAEARRDIVEAGRRLYSKGYVAATDGNISARVAENAVLVTPSGVCKGFLDEGMLVRLDLDGNVLEGGLVPSSEVRMHLEIYRRSPDVLGVVHAHPPVASAFAAAGEPLDSALLQEAVVMLGVVPVSPFATPGSEELALAAAAYIREYNGVLLEHHGAVAWGNGVMEALYRMERIEHCATVLMYLRLMGIERPMDEGQIDALVAMRPLWGIHGGGRPRGRGKKDMEGKR